MPAYVVANFRIHDHDLYSRYSAAALPIIADHGGTIVAADHQAEDLWSGGDSSRVVLIRFPDLATAKLWSNSDAYTRIAHLRTDASTTSAVLLFGTL